VTENVMPRGPAEAAAGTAGEPLDRSESLGYQVNHLARLLEQHLRVRIARYGVVPGQFAQLLALYEEEPLTQRELCERVRIEQSTMAYTLQRMERDGLVRRAPDPADARRSFVTLTERARELQEPLYAAAREVNRLATRDMSEPEVAAVMSAVVKMIDNFESGDDRRPQSADPATKASDGADGTRSRGAHR
jgi:DNA-binding MarR family transcriptional regulator